MKLFLLVMSMLAAPAIAADPGESVEPTPTAPASNPTRLIWFEDARYSPVLTDESVESIAAYVRQKLLLPDASPPLLTRQARDDFYPRVLFVSVSDGIHRARVTVGTARGILKAADHALEQLRTKGDEKFDPRWVKVDLASTILLQEHADLTNLLDYERSMFGLALGRQTGVALSPEELVGSDAISHQIFDKAKFERYLQQRLPATSYKLEMDKLEDVFLFRFATQSYFGDKESLLPLYRGHRQWRLLKKGDVLESCKAAANYLAQSVNSRGQFIYLYQPPDGHVDDYYGWSVHLMVVATMFDAYETLQDADLLAAARRALDYSERVMGSWKKNGVRVSCIVEHERVALRGNAMAALALANAARVTKEQAYLDRARPFAEALVQAQREDGSFIHMEKYPGGEETQDVGDDAQGRAVHALMQVYRVDPSKRWLDAAARGAKYLTQVRDKDLGDAKLPQDHYLMMALASLHEATGDKACLEYELRVASGIRSIQNRSPQYSDWLGSYFHLPNSGGTSLRNEGLSAAYVMFRRAGEEDEATATLEAIILGAAFQFTCQIRPEDAMYFLDPLRCIGAVKEGQSATDMRIDYTQQHLAAMLSIYHIMSEEKVDVFRIPPARPRPDGSGAPLDDLP